jgi:hypothetical protein
LCVCVLEREVSRGQLLFFVFIQLNFKASQKVSTAQNLLSISHPIVNQ